MTFNQLGSELTLHHIVTNPIHVTVTDILRNHGCTITPDGKKTTITYPENSLRREILLRAGHVRIQVILPDKVEVRETENPKGGMDISLVITDEQGSFTDEEFAILSAYKK